MLDDLFENTTEQKRRGAYYTARDVTDHIVRNTVLPCLLDMTARSCPSAFHQDGPVWSLLRRHPDRYLHPAVRHGIDLILPSAVRAGLEDVACRQEWNDPAPAAFALPAETWREHIARRRHAHDLRTRLLTGQVHTVPDLITANLALDPFLVDVLTTCEDPQFLWAFWQALTTLTILDPTCGAGAFLVAALEVLEALYEACLDRMPFFLNESPGTTSHARFPHLLAQVDASPGRRYFIREAILNHNLYGVDIMPEALAVCKSHLHLQLLSTLAHPNQATSLPDIRYHLRTGNALVGFVTQAETANREDLDQRLAREYGVAPAEGTSFERWRSSHRPFHWALEFPTVLRRGGFDVILGNPPYVEYSKVRSEYTVRNYRTAGCGNLSVLVLQRCTELVRPGGYWGLIVPLSLLATARMAAGRRCLAGHSVWASAFDMRPASLFEGVAQRLGILIATRRKSPEETLYTGGYRRWSHVERPALLATTRFTQALPRDDSAAPFAKITLPVERNILARIAGPPLAARIDDNAAPVYVHRICRYFVKALDFVPHFLTAGQPGKSEDYKEFRFREVDRPALLCLLNSSLFYWYWRVYGDGFHCGYGDVYRMPFRAEMDTHQREQLAALAVRLMDSLRQSSRVKVIRSKRGSITYQEFYPATAKLILDEIDHHLGRHYGLSAEEVDFLVNYDIKYRLRQRAGG